MPPYLVASAVCMILSHWLSFDNSHDVVIEDLTVFMDGQDANVKVGATSHQNVETTNVLECSQVVCVLKLYDLELSCRCFYP